MNNLEMSMSFCHGHFVMDILSWINILNLIHETDKRNNSAL